MNSIKGTLLYASIQEPAKPYIGPGEDANKPKEWKISVAIFDEDYADEVESFATGLGAKISMKKFKTPAEFKETFKIDMPEGVKKAWVVTLRRSTELGKTGKPVPDLYKPRVFMMQGNTRLDITHEKLVGNGSEGQVSLEVFRRDNGKNSIYLKNVLVNKLVEYVKPEGAGASYTPGDEFDSENDTPEQVPATKSAVPAKATKPVKPAKTDSEDDDSDIPF